MKKSVTIYITRHIIHALKCFIFGLIFVALYCIFIFEYMDTNYVGAQTALYTYKGVCSEVYTEHRDSVTAKKRHSIVVMVINERRYLLRDHIVSKFYQNEKSQYEGFPESFLGCEFSIQYTNSAISDECYIASLASADGKTVYHTLDDEKQEHYPTVLGLNILFGIISIGVFSISGFLYVTNLYKVPTVAQIEKQVAKEKRKNLSTKK